MFYDIFLQLCQRKGVKPGRAAEDCGINRSNVSLWKSRGYTPRGDALNRIAAYFGVTTDYLLGEGSPTEQPADDVDADPLAGALFAAYGEVKEEFDEDDIADIQAFMRMVAERKRKRAEKAQTAPDPEE